MTKERFFSKVKLYHGITDEDCWEWIGSKNNKGYGRINVNGINRIASRIAYKLFKPDFNRHLCVLHKCDSPSCVNPFHLFLGTTLDNNLDMVAKGRHNSGPRPAGESHVHSRLTDKQVKAIREAEGTQREIAKRFNISQAVVCNVRNKKAWAHVD